MSEIKITSRKATTLDIVDEDGKKIGKVSFNPKDIKAYNAFMKIYGCVSALLKKHEGIGAVEEIPEGKLGGVAEYQAASAGLEKIADFTDEAVAQFEKIYAQIDEIFGAGTSKLISQDSYDVEVLFEFLDGITPYFKNAQGERVSKYLDKQQTESDVM